MCFFAFQFFQDYDVALNVTILSELEDTIMIESNQAKKIQFWLYVVSVVSSLYL